MNNQSRGSLMVDAIVKILLRLCKGGGYFMLEFWIWVLMGLWIAW